MTMDENGSERGNEIGAYIAEQRKRRDAYSDEALDELRAHFRRRDRRPPEVFNDSSFLYIRSYDADNGERPFSGIMHWHSPDVLLSPVTSVGAYTTTLQAGETYRIRVVLRNRGDLAVPSAKVELFLTDPTLGFDTRFATRLTGLGSVPSAWVVSGGSAAAEFDYTVPPAEAGHKCLFARTFSFSPLELPLDDFALDPRLDRHVAQQNLNIVGQNEAYSFNLVHRPNARIEIALRALQPDALLALRHPVLADVRPAAEFPRRGWGRLAQLELVESDGDEIIIDRSPDGAMVTSEDAGALDLDAQREIDTSIREVLSAVQAGETRLSQHRDLVTTFRKMNAETRRCRFALTIPDIGLRQGEAVGVEITAVDRNAEPADTIGGIAIVIVGG